MPLAVHRPGVALRLGGRRRGRVRASVGVGEGETWMNVKLQPGLRWRCMQASRVWNANMFMSPLTISLCAMLYLQAITVYRAAVVVCAGMPTLIKCVQYASRLGQGKRVDEQERKAKLEEIALRMYVAGLGWNYDALERMTAPELPTLDKLHSLMRLPEPTPFERGVLDRYQDRRRR